MSTVAAYESKGPSFKQQSQHAVTTVKQDNLPLSYTVIPFERSLNSAEAKTLISQTIIFLL